MPIALVRPKSTEEVAQILRICHQAGQPIVPHGGLTGLVDATQSNQQELALSLERMNTIEEIDVQSRTMTVQAGVPLQTVQEKADEAGMLFPLDLGARGTATIGGNVSTNAGGNRVIRYGMMRDQVLGLEVVLADGTIISSMNKILKNNTGYDLKQLFIGSEGTLGVVTRIVLRMRPLPVSQEMALLAIDDFTKVTEFLNHIDSALGGTLSAYEVLWQDYYQLVTQPPAEGRAPLPDHYQYYVLLEALGGSITADQERFVTALTEALEQELIADAVIAQNQGERDALWAIRDDVGQVAQNAPIFAFDISVSLNHMESYVEELKASLTERWPDHSCMIFGHLGDGNLHIIVGNGDSSIEAKKAIDETVYAGLPARGGSVSAEHGIGLQKREYLSWSRNSDEINLMKMLKQSLDPKDILNPGKIFA
ncbi:FAD-binding oxidoreductase [Pseudomonadales bacterium]|nr:FAD-binding oxidoreductase [Pseudomonadales bacterium]MDB2543153.1 FAD-binding oxidoreductase [Pseudomonadales bacterium]